MRGCVVWRAATQVSREHRIRAALLQQLEADEASLVVEDLSGGCDGGTVRISVASRLFAGKSVVAQHRLVNQVIQEEMKSLHACHIRTVALKS